jgi:hypothetical protein
MAGSLSDEENLKTEEYQAYRQKIGPEARRFAAKYAWTDPGSSSRAPRRPRSSLQFMKQESFLTPARA